MFDRCSEEEYSVRRYLMNPERLNTVEDCRRWGSYAENAISEAQAFIRTMEEYQTLIYNRVQVLSSAPWHYEALLLREPHSWDNKIFYFVRLLRVYDALGIGTETISDVKYPGNERHKAFAAFEAMKKSHPGIIAVKDIEKRSWER